MKKRQLWIIVAMAVCSIAITACGKQENLNQPSETEDSAENETAAVTTEPETSAEQNDIETILNLSNNESQAWTYDAEADAWIMSVVQAVAYPELPDQQGVSVCVPGAYVTGIDANGDGAADADRETAEGETAGSLIIDYESQITSSNGQLYTAATAPVIVNTGAAGYGSSDNTLASAMYASEGYINIACGNRGKQDTVTDSEGNKTYTGDAPSCLADQKAAARFVKYNILLGNLPGNVDYFVSTGGSGGGAHAVMFAATSNNEDYYDYQIASGAVGVYQNEDGTYTTAVTIDGVAYEISDGAWGCIGYSAITSLAEADMALAFEYYLNAEYEFGTSFQAQLAEYLSEAYMEYINEQNLSVQESAVLFDLNQDGDMEDVIPLTISCDPEQYPETNGYYGTYLDLYLAEFTQNLQWYLDNLEYADGWTWFDETGVALNDEQVAAMTGEEKAEAFVEGRYAKATTGQKGAGMPDREGRNTGEPPEGMKMGELPGERDEGQLPEQAGNQEMLVGTPDAGTTQSADGGTDSSNYETYEDMVASYQEDIASMEAGDEYGNDLVSLYNPLAYIGEEGTENPSWVRIVMGAAEGDMSLFSSLNLQIAFLNAGVDAVIEWQWDGGHVPSETLGSSFALYVDQMYGDYVEGAKSITKQEAKGQTANGTAEEMTGTKISAWVNTEDMSEVSFELADAVCYRTAGASKAMPGFDVIDYGQEDYVFGNAEKDARHWNKVLLDIFTEHAEALSALFNQ